MIRVLIVDDQRAIRETLRVKLDIEPDLQVVGTASNGAITIQQVLEH